MNVKKCMSRATIASAFIIAATPQISLAAVVTDTFQVRIEITSACTVTAGAPSDIDLGTHPATDVDISGDNTITVNCSNTTPYYIGLQPSNGDTTGAGEMESAAILNTDVVPYQLRSTAGMAGTIWGNTATTTAAGNGIAGTGTGLDVDIPVYVTVDSANYTPDTYLDTVTVNVNY